MRKSAIRRYLIPTIAGLILVTGLAAACGQDRGGETTATTETVATTGK